MATSIGLSSILAAQRAKAASRAGRATRTPVTGGSRTPNPRSSIRGPMGVNGFRSRLLSLAALTGSAQRKNPAGTDSARGLGQAMAKVGGRSNYYKPRTRQSEFIDPLAAKLQHAVRNRSVEQGANAPATTTSAGASASNYATVLRSLL